MLGPRHRRPAGIRYAPIRLMMRQVLPVSDIDYRLISEPLCRMRFSTWWGAWRRLLQMVEEHPHWEWWLEEDLVRQKATGLRFSQICARCELWGVGRMDPGQTEPPRCVRCDHPAAPRDQPIRTSPRTRAPVPACMPATRPVDPCGTVRQVPPPPSVDRSPARLPPRPANVPSPHTGPHTPAQPIDPAGS